jgi:hypothetical protein
LNETALVPLAMVGAALALALVGWLLEVRHNVRLQDHLDVVRRAKNVCVPSTRTVLPP